MEVGICASAVSIGRRLPRTTVAIALTFFHAVLKVTTSVSPCSRCGSAKRGRRIRRAITGVIGPHADARGPTLSAEESARRPLRWCDNMSESPRCPEITDSAEKKARLRGGNRYNQKSTVDNIDTL